MQLSNSDILWLADQIKHCEERAKAETTGSFRMIMRAETAKLMINLAGYRFDYDKYAAYKISQKEEREYFNVSTTNSTTK